MVLQIVGFVGDRILHFHHLNLPFCGDDSWKPELFTSAFAVSLLYVTYFVLGLECCHVTLPKRVENPGRNIPIAIFGRHAVWLALSTLLLKVLFSFTS